MRVVGYVREAPVLGESETAYAQKEDIRRWTAESGHDLISVCQDLRVAGTRAGRPGYRALLDIVRSGRVDTVVVSDLAALSPDMVLQEIMLDDLRRKGVTVISTDPSQMATLEDVSRDQSRMIVRDVVARVRDYVREYTPADASGQRVIDLRDNRDDVIVELVRPHHTDVSAAHTARPTA